MTTTAAATPETMLVRRRRSAARSAARAWRLVSALLVARTTGAAAVPAPDVPLPWALGVLDVLDVAWGFDRPFASVGRVRVPLLFDGISVRSSSDEYSLAS